MNSAHTPGSPGPAEFALLGFLALAWGSSFLMIKIAVGSLPPITLAASRLVIAALILIVVAKIRGDRFPTGLRTWGLLLALGMTGNAIPFWLIAMGEQVIDSAPAAILMATVPLLTGLLAHFLVAGDRLTPARVAGIVTGFAGVLVLIGPETLGRMGDNLMAQLTVAAGAAMYAVTNIYAWRTRGLAPTVVAAGALGGAAVVMTAASLALEQPWMLAPTTESIGATLGLALLATTLGTLTYFRLLHATRPGFVAYTNYLVPLAGVGFGWLFLDEAIGWKTLGALLLILAGIAVSTWRPGGRAAGKRGSVNQPSRRRRNRT